MATGKPRLKILSRNFGCSHCHCLLVPAEKYQFCASGHILCTECHGDPKEKCPVEHDDDEPLYRQVGGAKYPLYKAICRAGLYSCVFAEHGCDQKLTFHGFEQHVREMCPFRKPLMCAVTGCYANFDNADDTLEHYQDYHAVRVMELNKNVQVVILYNRPEKLEMGFFTKSFQWVSTIFDVEGFKFVLAAREDEDKLTMWIMTYEEINVDHCYASIDINLTKSTEHREEFPLDILRHNQDPAEEGKQTAVLPIATVRQSLLSLKEYPGRDYLLCTVSIERTDVEDVGETEVDEMLNPDIEFEAEETLIETEKIEVEETLGESAKIELEETLAEPDKSEEPKQKPVAEVINDHVEETMEEPVVGILPIEHAVKDEENIRAIKPNKDEEEAPAPSPALVVEKPNEGANLVSEGVATGEVSMETEETVEETAPTTRRVSLMQEMVEKEDFSELERTSGRIEGNEDEPAAIQLECIVV